MTQAAVAVEKETPKLPSNRSDKCEVCDAEKYKYTCPRCEVRTCSLGCINIHKMELDCSGVRDKTAFKSMKKFTNLDLLSDYRLLEDISRTTLKYRKDVNKRYTRYNTTLPVQLLKLRNAAYSRGVRLQFLPQNFTRHQENSTYYEWKSKNFYWRIEWIFFTDAAVEKRIVDERLLDTDKLGKAVAKYLDPKTHDPELDLYCSASFSGVILLLKCEKTNNKFYELDPCSTIRANLRNKTIIEYPTIHVVLKYRKDEYDLMDSDDEVSHRSIHGTEDEKIDDDVCVIEKP